MQIVAVYPRGQIFVTGIFLLSTRDLYHSHAMPPQTTHISIIRFDLLFGQIMLFT
jgi:hypothetical protein